MLPPLSTEIIMGWTAQTRANIIAGAAIVAAFTAVIGIMELVGAPSQPVATTYPELPDYIGNQHQFTKSEFEAEVLNKTKSEVRAEFGSPDNVYDNDDSWSYNNLPIYDADAGTHAVVFIQFDGINDKTDAVAVVRYR
jgi:hypothetical protein